MDDGPENGSCASKMAIEVFRKGFVLLEDYSYLPPGKFFPLSLNQL